MEHNFAHRIIASTEVTAAGKEVIQAMAPTVQKISSALGKSDYQGKRAYAYLWSWAIRTPNFHFFVSLTVGTAKANLGTVGMTIAASDGGASLFESPPTGAFTAELPDVDKPLAAQLKKYAPYCLKARSKDEDAKKKAQETVQKLIRALS